MKKRIPIILFLFIVVSLSFMASCTQLTEIFNPKPPHTTCVDINKDTFCDTCGKPVTPAEEPECSVHVDLNNDGVCDKCSAAVLKNMTGVTFTGASFTYDGTDKTIGVVGAPADATVTYDILNVQKNVGEYKITATVTCEGYNPYTLSATMYVNPKMIVISWGELASEYPSNGKAPEIEYTLDGVIDGDEVEVTLDFGDYDFRVPGTYSATAVSANPNYKIRPKEAKIEVVMGQNIHTVSFDTGLDGKTINPERVLDGDTATSPRVPNNLGYDFIGWYNGDVEWNFNDPVTESMTLTAKWNPTEYKISYYLNGGENNENNPSFYTIETGAVIGKPTREGYVFLGWYEDASYATFMEPIKAGASRRDMHLYAKWERLDYTDAMSVGDITQKLTFTSLTADASFRYTLTANIAEFGNNGALYIGRGFDVLDGSYVKISTDKIEVYTNGADGPTIEKKSHVREMVGFIFIDVVVNKGEANLTMRTADGEFTATYDFAGRNGEIFAMGENIRLEDVDFAWQTEQFQNPVWILGDSTVISDAKTSWAYQLFDAGFVDALKIAANGLDSTGVLAGFKKALEYSTPKYALWSFETESGEAYDANLAEFIEICKNKEIVPILTTQLEAADEDNADKNAAVVASGERYVDFAALSEYEGIYDEAMTELGAKSFYGRLLSDFPEIITPTIKIRSESAEVLNAETPKLSLGSNKVRDGKFMVFSAKLDGELKEGQKIILAHGYMESYAKWFEITNTQTILSSYTSWNDPALKQTPSSHGLTIKNYITVIITADNDGVGNSLTIITDGGEYTREGYGWNSCQGEIFASVEGGAVLTDAKASWTCNDYDAPIWFVGASYFSLGDPARWPHYMYADKYTEDVFIVGRGGMDGKNGREEIADALQYGKPEYMIWGIGMNDGADKNGDINPKTLENKLAFLQICKENGIKALFMTIPNCGNEKNQNNDNTYKLDYVINRRGDFANYDYRVIDISHAVNGIEPHAPWYDNMLHSDGTHPTNLGARNFYLELLCNFPELMTGPDSTVYNAASASLSMGSSLSIDAPEFVDGDYAYTFSANFNGTLRGSIEIGNDKNVNGASWIKITESTIEVYRNVNGTAKLIHTEDNDVNMKELVMLRIHVKDNVANIALVSSGDKVYDSKKTKLFSFKAEWSFAGDVFASADTTNLTQTSLNFAVE